MTPLTTDDLLAAIDKEIDALRKLARLDFAEAKAWPAGSHQRKQLEATGGAFNHAASRLLVLKNSAALAKELAA